MRCDTKIIPLCPVLEPTEEQFSNFSEFVSKAEQRYKNQYGMIKIVPPKSWKPRSTPYEDSLSNLMVFNPIQQNAEGKMGIYQFKHIPMPSISYQDFIATHSSKQSLIQGKSLQEIEILFWQTILSSPPVYGADLLGTLMDSSAGSWNLNCLDTLLKKGLQKSLKGVNTSYCYIGSWKALFCWHKEDMDLQAINYLHFGKSKFWYCIQPQDSHILESQSKKHFFKGYELCPEYLRHKTTLINPYTLKTKHPQIRLCKIQQKQGQFIIAFSGAYHCGFNLGINVAEAVNFAQLRWLYKLKNVRHCKCKRSSVRVCYESLVLRLAEMDQYKNNDIVKSLKYQIESKSTQEQQQEEAIKAKKTKKIQKSVKGQGKGKNIEKLNKNINRNNIEQEELVTEIQCDICKKWHKISHKNKNYQQLVAFFCANLGQKCRNNGKNSENINIANFATNNRNENENIQ